MQQLDQTWNLEEIFAGGSSSTELKVHLESIESDIAELGASIQRIAVTSPFAEWGALFQWLQRTNAKLGEAASFVGCLTAADVKDQAAKLLSGRINQLGAKRNAAMNALDSKLLQFTEDVWERLLSDPGVSAIRFPLQERRNHARQRLDEARETLISDLNVDGYQAWSRLYNTLVGRMTLPYEEAGQVMELSMGQAANKLLDPDRNVREKVFEQWEKVWERESEIFASVLNSVAGYRLSVYQHRGWNSFLQEPVEQNRMTEQTLQVMWDVIERNKAPFVEYLQRKAQLLGVDRLSWHDTAAPLPSGALAYTYEEATDFVVRQFGQFSPDMARFAKSAIANRWVEAENRPNKGTGAFCTSFPVRNETRVFMTFSGTFGNVSTLAHELGHAYHHHAMDGLPYMLMGYAANVAETASTFAELIVSDAAIRTAHNRDARIALLEDKVQQAATMFMNLHSRFLFETRFYEMRKQGLLSADQLCDLMVQAQKDAYHGALSEYHPHFWASKGHFYNLGRPFYNFPYTFGYLFSNGIYARAREVGTEFAEAYVHLLRDTGRMSVEELAYTHLGVDLTQPDFWETAVQLAVEDAHEFLTLTEGYAVG